MIFIPLFFALGLALTAHAQVGPELPHPSALSRIDSLPDAETQKNALRQMSTALEQTMVVKTEDLAAVLSAANGVFAATACVHARYGPGVASQKLTSSPA